MSALASGSSSERTDAYFPYLSHSRSRLTITLSSLILYDYTDCGREGETAVSYLSCRLDVTDMTKWTTAAHSYIYCLSVKIHNIDRGSKEYPSILYPG